MREEPSKWIMRWAHLVKPGGTVLDVACGAGRHARWFADRGHPVTAVDRDGEAVASLPAGIASVVADLETGAWPFDERRFDAIVVTNYLWRPLMPSLRRTLAQGAVLLMETFALGQEAIGRPRNPAFLLARGELLKLVDGLRLIAFEDGYEPTTNAQVQRVAAVHEPVDGNVARRYPLASEGRAPRG